MGAEGNPSDSADSGVRYIAHHLSLFGLDPSHQSARAPGFTILYRPGVADLEPVPAGSGLVVAILPSEELCRKAGVTRISCVSEGPVEMVCERARGVQAHRLRTLHAFDTYDGEGIRESTVATKDGRSAWCWVTLFARPTLFIGTDLAADLIRYRQGDPRRVVSDAKKAGWGFDFERPNYLFDEQLEGEPPGARHADWWMAALADTLRARCAGAWGPILPGGAPGAIVLTGDDDQAYLERYDQQIDLLDGMPITYFLHPLTRHTRASMRSLKKRNRRVEFELHPDSLDSPGDYAARLDEQVKWFRRLVGKPPRAVRNHGFLNDGYWGHLPHWLNQGISRSANLPGLDGRILNGSLLPARVMYSGAMTSHWSVLTAIGDGVRYAGGMSDADAAGLIRGIAEQIRSSGVPGVLVLNLHPQNVVDTQGMHEAARNLVAAGFHAWNLGECFDWFENRGLPGGVSRDRLSGFSGWFRSALSFARGARIQ